MRQRKLNRGFTLIEVLIAAFVLVVGICSMLSLFTFSMASAESGWDRTLATSHAESMLEAMQNKPTLSEILITDWEQWASDHNLRVLPDERFRVTFKNPTANPLDIEVQVEWDRRLRTNNIVLETQLTK
jgi:prepilin-type N-terminal cleavage/methylation domain-containing protein